MASDSVLDIGTLGGAIELDDRLSEAIDGVIEKIHHFSEEFLGEFEAVALGATAVVAAIVGVAATITELGIHGSEVNSVTAGFDRLSGGVENAEKIMETMRAGVVGTMTEMELMTDANKLMATGFHGSAEQFGTLTSAARVLSREGFGPIPDILEKVDRAMMTGRVQMLGRMGLTIDLKTAEQNYAASLGLTVGELDPLMILEAKRQAILAAANKAVAEAGAQQLNFAERMRQAKTAIFDWVEELEKGVASSPHLTAALNAIQHAIDETFGTTSKSLLDAVLQGINNFADGVAKWAPPIIHFFGDVRDALTFLWDHRGAFEVMAVGVIAFKASLFAVGEVANGVTLTTTLMAGNISLLTKLSGGLATSWSELGLAIKLIATESLAPMLVSLAPVIVATAAVTATVTIGWQAWQLYKEKQEQAAIAAQNLAMDQTNLDRINKTLGTHFTDMGEAVAAATKYAEELREATPRLTAELKEQTDVLEAHKKKVDALVSSMRAAASSVDITSEAFAQMKNVELANAEVQAKWIPLFDAIIARGGQLTISEKAYYDQVTASRVNLDTYNTSKLAANNVTLEQINGLKALGFTETEIAQKLNTTTAALKLYTSQTLAAHEEATKLNMSTFATLAKLHGDNVNDWLKLEDMKYKETLQKLRDTGKATTEMLAAEAANYAATVQAEIQSRESQDVHSRAHFQKQRDEAKALLDLMLNDLGGFVAEDVRQAQVDFNEKEKTLQHWTTAAHDSFKEVGKGASDAAGHVTEITKNAIDAAGKVKTLAGEMITLAEKAARLAQGGSVQYDFSTEAGRNAVDPNIAMWLHAGYSLAQAAAIVASGGHPNPSDPLFRTIGPRVPGFAMGVENFAGGPAWVGERGPELVTLPSGANVTPGDKVGGTVVNHFHVNGTAEDVARKIGDILMRGVYRNVKFGLA